ncbi:hypothetical protein D3C87_219400 [compost metagenome]
MEYLGKLLDHRIQAVNVLVQVSMQEYLDIARQILNENEFQRKKVINGQISRLLREDITIGCSIPPLVLAIQRELISNDFDYTTFEDNTTLVGTAFRDSKLLILDGKQRTHIFIKLHDDLIQRIEKKDEISDQAKKDLESFLANTLRLEIYVGINKLNILYRMLTLNSGQTNMSTRHLMEMLYLDYLNIPFDGIRLIADKENEPVSKDPSEFVFKDVLDGFTSYLDKDENTLERSEILDNIKSAKNIQQEEKDKNLFEDFVITYKGFVDKMIVLSEGVEINAEDLKGTEFEVKGLLFGKTAGEIFKKSQAMSGFGAAIAELKDIRTDFNLDVTKVVIKELIFRDDDYLRTFSLLNKYFDIIRDKSKKIGNDQRFFFKMFFKHLFDPESSYRFSIDKSVEYGFKKLREDKSYLKDLNA